ncbi:hypothetical protein ACJJIQ_05330 [Microbulbifer sp. ANSA003]|uniref:hypothetical protein n=1 Tax=Microbulbifer sp. ANSA003 TaxID=3243360 RepID=UPI0040438F1F
MLNNLIKRFFSYIRGLYSLVRARLSQNIPEWAVVDLTSVSREIDENVWRDKKDISSIQHIDLPLDDKKLGRHYFLLKSSLRKKSYSYVFISQNLEAALDFASKYFKSEGLSIEDGKALFVLVEEERSYPLNSLCSSFDVVSVGSLNLNLTDLSSLVERLLIQLGPEKILLVSSSLCWRLLRNRVRTLRYFSEVAVYFPENSDTHDKLPDLHLENCLIECMPFLNYLIFSDHIMMDRWQASLGYFDSVLLSNK